MQKISLVLLIIVIAYVVGIFQAPSITNSIAQKIGIEGFNTAVLNMKKTIDGSATQDLGVDDFKHTFSGATDIVDGMQSVKDTVTGLKDTIGDLRVTLSGAEDTYNKAKNTYDDTVNFIDDAGKKIDNAKNALEDLNGLGETLKGTVNTDIVK